MVSGRKVVRLTMVRGVWPKPGSWEIQMNWDGPRAARAGGLERRPGVFARRDGGPWERAGEIIEDAKRIITENKVFSPSGAVKQTAQRGESPGSLRNKWKGR
jgi:hypothetical protein